MLKMYSQPSCAPCNAAERVLTADGIPFEKIDITQDPDAHQRVTQAGFLQTPVFRHHGELKSMDQLPAIRANERALLHAEPA